MNKQQTRNRVNIKLSELSSRYHDSLPIIAVKTILADHGLHLEPGIYCGRDGSSHEAVGYNLYLKMTWHKLEVTGQWEIIAYVS